MYMYSCMYVYIYIHIVMIMIMLITITCFFAYNYIVRTSVKKTLFFLPVSHLRLKYTCFFTTKKKKNNLTCGFCPGLCVFSLFLLC